MTARFYVTRHTLDRFREHHPGATWDEVRSHVRYGLEADKEVIREMLCREYAKTSDTYVLAPDRHGVFIISNSRDGRQTVVTYLRLSEWHHAWALDRWPTSYAG